jgi:hypothetical protein
MSFHRLSFIQHVRRKSFATLLLSGMLLAGTHTVPAQAGGDKTPRSDRFVVQLDPTSGVSIEQLNAEYNTYLERPLMGLHKGFVIRARAATEARQVDQGQTLAHRRRR